MMAGRQLHTPLGEARLLWLFTLLSLALAGWRWRQGAAAPVRATACPPPTQQGGGAGGGARGWPTRGDTIHTLLTSNGSPYTNYQTLALYGSYRRVQRMPGGDKMVAFTRILHRTADDELSRVVPTHRVQPLHPECDGREAEDGRRWTTDCGYPPGDRPAAVARFMAEVERTPALIRAPWIYFIETDYLLVKPVHAPGPAESAVPALGFRFPNIAYGAPRTQEALRKVFPEALGPLSAIPQTGPAPIMARVEEWVRVAPRYAGIMEQINGDESIIAALDWVREMWAFSVAAAVERLHLALENPGASSLIIQPPVHRAMGNASAIHYTFGAQIKSDNGTTVLWRFNKRDWTEQSLMTEVPPIPMPPPLEEGFTVPGPDVKPPGRNATQADIDFFTQLATTFNQGLEEVGGAKWREVLGREAVAAAAAQLRAAADDGGSGG